MTSKKSVAQAFVLSMLCITASAAIADVREFEIKREVEVDGESGQVVRRIDGKTVTGSSKNLTSEAGWSSVGRRASHNNRVNSGLVVPEKDLDQVLTEIQEQYSEGGPAAPAFPAAPDRAQNSFVRPEMLHRGNPEDQEVIADDEDG